MAGVAEEAGTELRETSREVVDNNYTERVGTEG